MFTLSTTIRHDKTVKEPGEKNTTLRIAGKDAYSKHFNKKIE